MSIRRSVEIERRFRLLAPIAVIRAAFEQIGSTLLQMNIEQVYMPDAGAWTIRGRKQRRTGWSGLYDHILTLKLPETKVTATEIESALLGQDYEHMVALAEHAPLRKYRWALPGATPFTFDLFLNPQIRGLEIAEIELRSEDEEFERPWWLGEDITDSFSNKALAKSLPK